MEDKDRSKRLKILQKKLSELKIDSALLFFQEIFFTILVQHSPVF